MATRTPRHVLSASLAVVLAAAAVLVGCSYLTERREASPAVLSTDSTTEFRARLISAGLAPESMAFAGVSAAQVGPIVAAARVHLADHATEIAAADVSFAAAARDTDRLERLVLRGLATPAEVASLVGARTGLAAATAARDAAYRSLFDAATTGLDEAQRAALRNARNSTGSAADLPARFRGTDRSDDQHVVLRDALADRAIAGRLGHEVDPASAVVIADAEASPESVRAAHAVTAASEVRQSWHAATASP